MRQPSPKQVDLSAAEVEALKQRLHTEHLSSEDKQLLGECLDYNIWVNQIILKYKMSIHKLRKMIFGKRSEKRTPPKKEKSPNTPETHVDPPEDTSNPSNDEAPEPTEKASANSGDNSRKATTKKGHGRRAANEYQADLTIFVPHPDHRAGDPCPYICKGKLYPEKPGSHIRIVGQAIAKIHHYDVEILRCNLCKAVFKAVLPEEAGSEKYDAYFKATVVIQKYFAGMPFYRQHVMQKMLNFHLSASKQWECAEFVGGLCIPLFQNFEYYAAQVYRCFIDDTGCRIAEVISANKEKSKKDRQGMHTAGILAQGKDYSIILFYHGVETAGCKLTALLKNRQADLPPMIRMADALTANSPKAMRAILCKCLTHARRNFIDVEKAFPEASSYVINQIANIYRIDDEAKTLTLDDQQRLIYHQKHSQPVMDTLYRWLNKQIDEHHVEPNSLLGDAIQYVLTHWEGLTQFLRVAGAPLDNNAIEQLLKIPIRIRKNSYFFKTLYSAYISSILNSIVATCYINDVNPAEYLVAVQEHKDHIVKAPRRWMPWNYQEALNAMAQKAA